MKRLLFLISLSFFGLLFSLSSSQVAAQSPIRCGLVDETCCSGASFSTPCQTGLTCDSATNKCVSTNPNASPPTRGQVTNPSPTSSETETSITCTANGEDGVSTAIGCIPYGDTNAFLGFILGWAIGIGGGIAFLLILVAGFQIMTSSGNPDRLKGGQELMTSAIAGLIMLIFSIFILKLIGVDILGLDKFGFPSL